MEVTPAVCCQAVIPMTDPSRAGEARRAAIRLADMADFDTDQQGRAAIVATELANNLLKYARGGELLIQCFPHGTGKAVDLLAIDRGPGMSSVESCLQDGFSTGGTPGTGLGAVRRLSTEFDLYSTPPGGTVAFSRIAATPPRLPFLVGAVCRPAAGELVCGDSWHVAQCGSVLSVLVVDGLGHGPLAAEAADIARDIFAANPLEAPELALAGINRALSGTRGAAVLIVQVDIAAQLVRHCGAGNISGSIVTHATSKGLASGHGIVGVNTRKYRTYESPWTDYSILILHSDGLRTRWAMGQWPGASQRHPAVLAGLLARDFERGNDDLTVLVLEIAHG